MNFRVYWYLCRYNSSSLCWWGVFFAYNHPVFPVSGYRTVHNRTCTVHNRTCIVHNRTCTVHNRTCTVHNRTCTVHNRTCTVHNRTCTKLYRCKHVSWGKPGSIYLILFSAFSAKEGLFRLRPGALFLDGNGGKNCRRATAGNVYQMFLRNIFAFAILGLPMKCPYTGQALNFRGGPGEKTMLKLFLFSTKNVLSEDKHFRLLQSQ